MEELKNCELSYGHKETQGTAPMACSDSKCPVSSAGGDHQFYLSQVKPSSC